jgi:hypothetical protein
MENAAVAIRQPVSRPHEKKKMPPSSSIIRPALLCLSLINGSAIADDALTAYAGAEYSRGKFGQPSETETWNYPLSVKYEHGPFTLKGSISYLMIKGPANVVGSGEDFIDLGGNVATRSVSGWGDVVVSGLWTAYEAAASGWLVDLGGKVKFGTADDTKGLGTGKNDYSAEVDIYKRVGAGTLFVTVGKRKMGDPEGIDLRDPVFTTLGWSQRLSRRTSAGLMHDFRQPVIAGHEPAREVTAFVTHKFSDTWKVQGYAVRGFSDASPDVSLGFIFSVSYF